MKTYAVDIWPETYKASLVTHTVKASSERVAINKALANEERCASQGIVGFCRRMRLQIRLMLRHTS